MGFELGLQGGGKKRTLENIPAKGTYLIKDKKNPNTHGVLRKKEKKKIKHWNYIVYTGFQSA